jgi:hypothetical protein
MPVAGTSTSGSFVFRVAYLADRTPLNRHTGFPTYNTPPPSFTHAEITSPFPNTWMMPMAGARNSNKPDRRIKLRKPYDGGEFLRLVLSIFYLS